MKNITIVSILIFFFTSITLNSYAGHCMHPLSQISYVKKKIAEQQEPYYSAYKQLIHYSDSIQQSPYHALADFAIPGFYDKPQEHRKNSLALQQDAFGAYCSALAYQLSGIEKYGEKACYFLNSWASVNKGYAEHDGVLIMTYSGSGLLMAAELMADSPLWTDTQKENFKKWVSNVYQKATNEIRVHKNNWADWGRFGSLLASSFLGEKQEIERDINLIKSDLFVKIANDGHMPEEVVRGNNGLWYTYFSLAPMTAACWLIYNLTGENLFVYEHNGTSIKKAVDYLLYYQQHPQEWTWDKNPNIGTHNTWPDNLLEAMAGIYNDASYIQYISSSRPHIYPIHHFAWSFPTLMPVSLSGFDLTDNNTWANYNKYALANKNIKKPIAVFIGNSITEGWYRTHLNFFTQNNYVGRGISGQVTAQMLARFRADVIDLKPQVVSILAGTNDIAQNCMYISIKNIADNIFSMAELAKANGIKVIICSTLPATHYSWNPTIKDPAKQIIELNKRLKNYTKEHHITYIDFHSLMKDKSNGLPSKYSKDGVHPTEEGFSYMEPIIKQAVDSLLNIKSKK
jgi:lysophospholipase L1-like esterase